MRFAGRVAPVTILGLVWMAMAPPVGGNQPPTLPSLLGAAAVYVAAYEQQAAAIVFEETYSQRVSRLQQPGLPSGSATVVGSRERRLRSDVVVVNADAFGWIGFRDVFEVDGKPVRDRQDRFQRLFGQPISQAVIDQARVIANESARFNLGSVGRNLNYPTMALMFLRQDHQPRSAFSREGSARVGNVVTWMLDFQEVERPTLIGSPGYEVATTGRFWVEPDSGRVRRSRITVDVGRATCTYEVEYGYWSGLNVLVPVSMDENVAVRGDDRLERGLRTAGDPRPVEMIRGEARYSNFRQFKGTARIKEAVIVP
jgi:hypothetical protein